MRSSASSISDSTILVYPRLNHFLKKIQFQAPSMGIPLFSEIPDSMDDFMAQAHPHCRGAHSQGAPMSGDHHPWKKNYSIHTTVDATEYTQIHQKSNINPNIQHSWLIYFNIQHPTWNSPTRWPSVEWPSIRTPRWFTTKTWRIGGANKKGACWNRGWKRHETWGCLEYIYIDT